MFLYQFINGKPATLPIHPEQTRRNCYGYKMQMEKKADEEGIVYARTANAVPRVFPISFIKRGHVGYQNTDYFYVFFSQEPIQCKLTAGIQLWEQDEDFH